MTTSNNVPEYVQLAPAYLFITPDSQALEHIVTYLQKNICLQQGCKICTVCLQIKEKQSPFVCWIAPENRYTLDDFDIVFKKIAFALDHNTEFFFVIEQSQLLSVACANALLKIVEEPPRGYHFIFSTSTLQAILPTLRSRCRIITYGSTFSKSDSNLTDYFTTRSNPNAFLKAVSTTTITEFEIITFIDLLLAHYLVQLNTLMTDEKTSSNTQLFLHDMITYLQRTLERGVMTGSSKLFLKDLYLYKTNLEKKYELT